jgi:mevalonate kinase
MYGQFHGKVLLFGEYTIITGSEALVTPLKRFSGSLEMPLQNQPAESFTAKSYAARSYQAESYTLESNLELRRFLEYLTTNIPARASEPGTTISGGPQDKLDLLKMGRELERGLYFRSTIPTGYGAGSSAALTAAVYDAFAVNRISRAAEISGEMAALRQLMGRMESHFHGTSSGIDPVCCYTGRTIHVKGELIHAVRIPALPDGKKFFLIDAGEKGETGPLVNEFKNKLETEPAFAKMINGVLSPLVGDCINNLVGGSLPGLSTSLKEISECQFNNFGSMIPERIKEIWEQGLGTGTYTLKLCGSGGGGYFLGFSDKWEKASGHFQKIGLEILSLDL